MRKILLLTFLFILVERLSAQSIGESIKSVKEFYLDSLDRKTTKIKAIGFAYSFKEHIITKGNKVFTVPYLRTGKWIEYFENGEIREIAHYLNNKLNGSYTRYSENRKIELSANCLNDKYNGSFKTYYDNGNIRNSGTFLNAKKIGQWILYHQEGYKLIEEHYTPRVNDEVLDGPYIEYFKNGNKYIEKVYKQGNYSGPWYVYYENGNKRLQATYCGSTGNSINDYFMKIACGKWISYWEDGKEATIYNFDSGEITYVNSKQKIDYPMSKGILSRGEILMSELEFQTQNGKYFVNDRINKGAFVRQGVWEFYKEDKTIVERVNFDRTTNKANGEALGYFPDGKPRFKLFYKNGEFDGPAEYYYNDGIVKERGLYTAGKKNGIWVSYNSDGKKSTQTNYNQNIEEGAYENYFINGNLKEKGNYRNGAIVGKVEYYHPNGKFAGVLNFTDGNLVSYGDFFDNSGNLILKDGIGSYITYHSNGQLSNRFKILKHCRDGLAEWFYDTGQLQQSATYLYSDEHKPFGLRWEVLSSFTRDGKPREKGSLKNGTGTWISYDEKGDSIVSTYISGILSK